MLRPFRRNSFLAFVQAFEIFKTDTANQTHQRVHEQKKKVTESFLSLLFFTSQK